MRLEKTHKTILHYPLKLEKTGAAGISQRLKNEFVEWMMEN